MNPEENIARLKGVPRFKQVFIQPFAIVLVSVIFVILTVIMGLTDMRRSEKMLVEFVEDQGRQVIGVVEKLTDEGLRNMIDASRQVPGKVLLLKKEPMFLPDKSLTDKIFSMAWEIERHWKKEHISASYVRQFALDNNIWLVAVLDLRGNLIFQSRYVDQEMRASAGTSGHAKQSAQELVGRLNSLNNQHKIGYVGISRKDRGGTIILALDRESMRYWGKRVSVEKAMEKLGEGQGLIYLCVRDKMGNYLGSIGDIPGNGESVEKPVSVRSGVVVGFKSVKTVSGERSIQQITAPFYIGKEEAGWLLLGIDRGNTDRIMRENRRNVYLFLVFVITITLLSLLLLYNNQNRHLARVVEMTRQLEKAERLSSLGMLAAGVAHEIRNPLNAISMASQRLKREFVPVDEEKKKEFESIAMVIRDEIRRLNGIIEEFLTFSKSRRLELRENVLQDVLQKIVNLVSPEAADKYVRIRTDWPDDPVVIPMDMDKLQQAMLNFVKNAIESITGSGEVSLEIKREGRGLVRIVVTDTGCGMAPDEIERIFNPEYTTKEKGLGLGLSLAHEIIRGHGGEIRVNSKKGEGTVFEIFMPTERRGDKAAA